MTSPGTSSRLGTSDQLPSRRTEAVGATSWRIRSTARCERKVCIKLRAALRTTISAMIEALRTSPTAAEIALATKRMIASGFMNKKRIWTRPDVRRAATGSLVPIVMRRRRASAVVRPAAGFTWISDGRVISSWGNLYNHLRQYESAGQLPHLLGTTRCQQSRSRMSVGPEKESFLIRSSGSSPLAATASEFHLRRDVVLCSGESDPDWFAHLTWRYHAR